MFRAYRFGAPLFFGNADVFRNDMRRIAEAADGKLHTVVINADALGIPDATAHEALLRAQRVLAEREVGEFTVIDEATSWPRSNACTRLRPLLAERQGPEPWWCGRGDSNSHNLSITRT